MTSPEPHAASNLWPATLAFTLTYLAASAVVTGVLTIFDLDSNTGLAVGLLMAGVVAAAYTFVGRYGRGMDRREQLRFAVLGTLAVAAATLLQVLAVGLYFFKLEEWPQVFEEMGTWAAANTALLAIIVALIVLLTFAVLYFSSGWLTRSIAKRNAATAKI